MKTANETLNYKFLRWVPEQNWDPRPLYDTRDEYIKAHMYEGIGVDMTYDDGSHVERVWLDRIQVRRMFGIKVNKADYQEYKNLHGKDAMVLKMREDAIKMAANSPEVKKYFTDYAAKRDWKIL